MKTNIRRLLGLCLALAVMLAMVVPAYAAVIDVNKTGTLQVYMSDPRYTGDRALPGVTIAIYRVGRIVNLNNGSSALTSEFSGAGVSLNGLTNAQAMNTAAALARYAANNAIAYVGTGVTNAEGIVRFSGLELGVYLVVLYSDNNTDVEMAPFMVQVPYTFDEGEYWYYVIQASPKTDVEPPPPVNPPTYPPTTPPTNPPPRPTTPDVPTVNIPDTDPPLAPPTIEIPDEDVPLGNLPKTGVLQWPIPVLAVSGMLMFGSGWKINMKKPKENEE